MKVNRILGLIIIAIGILLMLLIGSYSAQLKALHHETCTQGPTCPLAQSMDLETYSGYISGGVLVFVGVFLMLLSEYKFKRYQNRQIYFQARRAEDWA